MMSTLALLSSCLCNKNNKKQKAQRADKDDGDAKSEGEDEGEGEGEVEDEGEGEGTRTPGGLQHRPVIENTIHVVLSGKDFRRQEGKQGDRLFGREDVEDD